MPLSVFPWLGKQFPINLRWITTNNVCVQMHRGVANLWLRTEFPSSAIFLASMKMYSRHASGHFANVPPNEAQLWDPHPPRLLFCSCSCSMSPKSNHNDIRPPAQRTSGDLEYADLDPATFRLTLLLFFCPRPSSWPPASPGIKSRTERRTNFPVSLLFFFCGK